MKILKLIFENINSYEGVVEIDFTDPDFEKGNNQFVICGPMGSGKSTILDAITLSMYGRTPRLDKLNMKEMFSELMNKHSGYCRSEVIYACAKGEFKSTFEINRAREKTDGALQDAQYSLYRMEDGEPVENLLAGKSMSELNAKTEELTGLSYDQFIRCILIPQGEFDKFLTSDVREKAAIMAKLSGTEYYKEAARILNEKASAIKQDYTVLKEKRDAILVLGEEERKSCEDEKTALDKQIHEWDQALADLSKKINWLEKLREVESGYLAAENNKKEVEAGAEDYRLKMKELGDAEKADECDRDYRSLNNCAREREKVKEQQSQAEEVLAQSFIKLEELKKDAKDRAAEYEKKTEEREKQKEIWRKVRELDTKTEVAQNKRNAMKDAWEKAKAIQEKEKARLGGLEDDLKKAETKIGELTDYLLKNSADEGLEGVLASYDEKMKQWEKADAQRSQAEEKRAAYAGTQERLIKQIEELKKQRDEAEQALYSLVSSKYLLVADILRRDLKPGSVCPVCGKEYVSNNDADRKEMHVYPQTGLDEEQGQVAADISALVEDLETKKKDVESAEGKLRDAEQGIKIAEQDADAGKAAMEALLAECNALLQPWGKKADGQTSGADFEEIKKELSERKDRYKTTTGELEKIKLESEAKKAEISSVDLKRLQENEEIADRDLRQAEAEYQKLEKDRRDLFGTQSVDEIESAFDADIRKKELEKKETEKNLQEMINKCDVKQAEIKGLAEQNKKLEQTQSELEKSFREKLMKNKFSSEGEFLSCLRSEETVNELKGKTKEYEHKKTVAETTYENAKKAVEALRAESLTRESGEELNEKKNRLEELKTEGNQKLGGLEEQLRRDDRNKKDWSEADAKLQKLGADAEIYDRINKMLGVKDGADFEVFVQGIAMASLLGKANAYLQGIIPQYCLVQRAENSVDFIVHETMDDLTVIKREVTNFSGGEKFIISLSLALAMAEFAGRKGGVQCIFLDEGFGTLSGAPLQDAINALKKLQNTGKMLGIITHIDAVIQEFNRIEAVRVGEKSILSGPGVHYTEAHGKQRKKKAK